MRILLNGEARELDAGTTVEQIINRLELAPGARGIAVALDGEVVPRGAWAATALSEGARVEVVAAVQGG